MTFGETLTAQTGGYLLSGGEKKMFLSSTDPSLQVTANGVILTRDGIVRTFSLSGNLVSVQDQSGITNIATSSAQMIITNPHNLQIILTLAGGKVSTIQDPSGNLHTPQFTGDDLAGVVSTNPSGSELDRWAFTYANGLIRTQSHGGKTTTYNWSGGYLEKISSITVTQGETTTVTNIGYPEAGRTTISSPTKGTVEYQYPAANSLYKTNGRGNFVLKQALINGQMISFGSGGMESSIIFSGESGVPTVRDAWGVTQYYPLATGGEGVEIRYNGVPILIVEMIPDGNGGYIRRDFNGNETRVEKNSRRQITRILSRDIGRVVSDVQINYTDAGIPYQVVDLLTRRAINISPPLAALAPLANRERGIRCESINWSGFWNAGEGINICELWAALVDKPFGTALIPGGLMGVGIAKMATGFVMIKYGLPLMAVNPALGGAAVGIGTALSVSGGIMYVIGADFIADWIRSSTGADLDILPWLNLFPQTPEGGSGGSIKCECE